jgi:excinuclease UvrABC nuclease subunit
MSKSKPNIIARLANNYIPPYTWEEVKNMAGVYVIVNSVNNHKYVGQSKNLLKRMRDHFHVLDHGRHPNSYLQNAYNLHGRQSFVFVVLEYIPDLVELNDREQYWIEHLRPEYNIVKNIFEWSLKVSQDPTEPIVLRVGETFQRPAWHAWVYGGARNPSLDVSRNSR